MTCLVGGVLEEEVEVGGGGRGGIVCWELGIL